MRVELTEDVNTWAAATTEWLALDPVQNNLLLSLALEPGSAQGSPAQYAWIVDGDKVAGAARAMHPFPITISQLSPDAIGALVDELAARLIALPGVNGPAASAAGFAATWTARVGRPHTEARRSQLLRCDEVVPAPQPSGRLRPATLADAGPLTGWFSVSVGGSGLTSEQARAHAAQMVQTQTAAGRLLVWEDDGIVGAAGWAQPVHRVARPRPIYIDPRRRGGGYARALVAAVSAHALADGADTCMCYSDLSYGAMTTILEQVGYRYVQDVTEYRFG